MGDPGASRITFDVADCPAILAMGADLKASLCLAFGGKAHCSEILGDLQDAATFDRYLATIARLEATLAVEPRLLVCDAHPGYISSNLARESGLPLLEVQHHHAHVASVMAEHGLIGPVIGVAMDGAGYGDDGAIWGGEFLLCQGGECRRIAHLEYTTLVGGDHASRDAGQVAACHLLRAGLDVPETVHQHPGFLRAAIEAGIGCAASSSMGRLFDVVSALLGVCGYNDTEGQCAILLQQSAEKARNSGVPPVPMEFSLFSDGDQIVVDHTPIIRDALAWRGGDAGAFALGFHVAVAEMIAAILAIAGEKYAVRKVVLSGGVFQNRLLRELSLESARREKYAVFANIRVPPSDGGIALGQAYIAAHRHQARYTVRGPEL